MMTNWQARPGRFPTITAEQAAFLEASTAMEARGKRRRRLAAAGLATVTAIAVTGAAVAIGQTAAANHERDIAVAGEIPAQSEAIGASRPVISQLLSLAAWRLDPTPAARFGMIAALVQPQIAILSGFGAGPVVSVAFSQDGRTFAAMGTNGKIKIWDRVTRHQEASFSATEGAGLGRQLMALSPDGRELAFNSSGSTVQLWDIPAHRQIGNPFNIHPSGLANPLSMAFSPSGRILATANGAGSIQLGTRPPTARSAILSIPLRRALKLTRSRLALMAAHSPPPEMRVATSTAWCGCGT